MFKNTQHMMMMLAQTRALAMTITNQLIEALICSGRFQLAISLNNNNIIAATYSTYIISSFAPLRSRTRRNNS